MAPLITLGGTIPFHFPRDVNHLLILEEEQIEHTLRALGLHPCVGVEKMRERLSDFIGIKDPYEILHLTGFDDESEEEVETVLSETATTQEDLTASWVSETSKWFDAES
jgi:hypothetical protein